MNLDSTAADAFYEGAMSRITRLIPILSLIALLAGQIVYGWRCTLGLACGCAIAYLNFYWLKRVVTVLADKATEAGKSQSGKGVIFRFLLRYLLMGGAAYAIFTVSPASLNGLFAGLFVPVAAIACETIYEVFAALARGL
jgi:hypothetical protein